MAGPEQELRRKVVRLQLDAALRHDVELMVDNADRDPKTALNKAGVVLEQVLTALRAEQGLKRLNNATIEKLKAGVDLPATVKPQVELIQKFRNLGSHFNTDSVDHGSVLSVMHSVVSVLQWHSGRQELLAAEASRARSKGMMIGLGLGAALVVGATALLTISPFKRDGPDDANARISSVVPVPLELSAPPDTEPIPVATPLRTGPIKLAAWNLSSLANSVGKGSVPRTGRDYERLKEYAIRLNADVIAVQEVAGAMALARVFPTQRYDFYVSGRDAERRTGIVVRRGLPVTRHSDFTALNTTGHLRRGVDLSVSVGSEGGKQIELRILSIHLKAYCTKDSLKSSKRACHKLAAQVPALAKWIRARTRQQVPFLVAGDFNRRLFDKGDEMWTQLEQTTAASLWSPTREAAVGCWGRFDGFVDHLLFNQLARDHVLTRTFSQQAFDATDEPFAKQLSDHCPISVMLQVTSTRPQVQPQRQVQRHATGKVRPQPRVGRIKGNFSKKSKRRIYHLPSCPDYAKVRITGKKERYFDSEAEARAAGFTRASNCGF